jgi:hypothetical protein
MRNSLAALGRILIKLGPQFLGCWLAGIDRLLNSRGWVIHTLEERSLLAGLDVKVVLTDDTVTVWRQTC